LRRKSLAVFRYVEEVLKLKLESYSTDFLASLLAVATEQGHFEVARHLLIMGVDVHGSVYAKARDPLRLATKGGHGGGEVIA
jgi:hypothetical protein